MVLSQKSKLVTLTCVTVAALSLSGCVDPRSNQDRISSRSGNANEANTAMQAERAWPVDAYNTHIRRGG